MRKKRPPAALPPPASSAGIVYVRDPEPPRVPTPVLALDSLGRMPTPTAVTLILSTVAIAAGTVVAVLAVLGIILATVAAIVGMVAMAAMGLGLAAVVLGGRASPTR
jgi:hypothetical protein